jgi:hypothetical protein
MSVSTPQLTSPTGSHPFRRTSNRVDFHLRLRLKISGLFLHIAHAGPIATSCHEAKVVWRTEITRESDMRVRKAVHKTMLHIVGIYIINLLIVNGSASSRVIDLVVPCALEFTEIVRHLDRPSSQTGRSPWSRLDCEAFAYSNKGQKGKKDSH